MTTRDDLDAALQEAVSLLTLGISDALGPVRPVTGLAANDRRASKTLLRAMERAYVTLKAVDAQYAYDMIAQHGTPAAPDPKPKPKPEPKTLTDYYDFQPSTSVRAIPAGLPSLGRSRP